MDGGQGYDEDQIALVIPDLSNFVALGPYYSGDSHTISCMINMIKEKEIDALVMHWLNVQSGLPPGSLTGYSYNRRMVKQLQGESDPSEYDEIATTKDTQTTDAFSSHMSYTCKDKDQLTLERGSM